MRFPSCRRSSRTAFGVGPAAALLTTLPAVSLPSLGMLNTSLPPRALAFLGVTVPVLGVLSGAVAVAFGV